MGQGSVLSEETVNGTVFRGTIQVVHGVAEAVFALSIEGHGSLTFSAAYRGNSQFAASTSNSVTVNV